MSWQLLIIIQTIAGSANTLWLKRFSNSSQSFFSLGIVVYSCVFISGILSNIVSRNHLVWPGHKAWLYILAEATFIPISWLSTYWLIRLIGAGNAAITTTVNYAFVALAGVLLLGDKFSGKLLIGGGLLLSAGLMAVSAQLSRKNRNTQKASKRAILVFICSALFLALGLTFEKKAINTIGYLDYAFFGWGAQLVAALIYFSIFGRTEKLHLTDMKFIKGAAVSGFLTGTAGFFFINSLSKTRLSVAVVAASFKVTLTVTLAIFILHEKKHLKQKLAALTLAIVGMVVLFQI